MKASELYNMHIGSRRNKKKASAKKSGTAIVKKAVNHYERFTRDPEIEADIVVPPSLFTAMSAWFHEGSGREITGYGVLSPEGDLVWTTYTDTGSSGFVTNSGDGAVEALMAAMKAGHDYVNLHWHTHPDMGPFYSTTDMEHHSHRAKSSEVGDDITYLVFDGAYWLTRRVIVTGRGGECSYNDGVVYLGDSESPLPSKKYSRSNSSWQNWSPSSSYVHKRGAYTTYRVCDSCFDDFGTEYGLSLGRVGEVCFACDKIIEIDDGDIPDGSTLSDKESMLRDEAEDILDRYLDMLEDFGDSAGFEYLKSQSDKECFSIVVDLIRQRPGLINDSVVGAHVKSVSMEKVR